MKQLLLSVVLLAALGWTACSAPIETLSSDTPIPSPTGAELASFLASLPLPEGWQESVALQRYNPDNLFDYMDGEAELYFTYRFARLVVGQYEGPGGMAMAVELYEVANPADAYGLYTYYHMGEPLDLGQGAVKEPGYRLTFWQNRFFARVFSMKDAIPDETLMAFARRLSALLPSGGEPPSLVDMLPLDGLRSGSVVFFHDKLVLDNLFWLGIDNALGLTRETDAVLGSYERSGTELQLLLVQYPSDKDAAETWPQVQAAEWPDVALRERAGVYIWLVAGDDSAAADALSREVAAGLP